jgi:hypothetical protein
MAFEKIFGIDQLEDLIKEFTTKLEVSKYHSCLFYK